jgi:hypothetical protein
MDRRCSTHEMNAMLRSGYNSPEGPGRKEQSLQASQSSELGMAVGNHDFNSCV